jgi:hypothetical protein
VVELSNVEAHALSIVRSLHHSFGFFADGVPTREVLDALAPTFGVAPVREALRSLVSKGLLSKPRRGYYLPTEENA